VSHQDAQTVLPYYRRGNSKKQAVTKNGSSESNKRIVGFRTTGTCSICVNGKRHSAQMRDCQVELVVSDAVHREMVNWSLRNFNPRISGSLTLEDRTGDNGDGREVNN
jgi:hypothetical protein